MATIIVKLIDNNKTKLIQSNEKVVYSDILSVYESLVQPHLHIGNSNVLFKNDKGEIFEIDGYKSFWSYINLEYPNAKDNIYDVPVIIIPVIVDNSKNFYNNNLTIHRNIICDICDNTIFGVRYKCTICCDYDICQNCEKFNNHDPSHVMLRFSKPLDNITETFFKSFDGLKLKNEIFNERNNNRYYESSPTTSDLGTISYESFENEMSSNSGCFSYSSSSDCNLPSFNEFGHNDNNINT